MSSEAEFIQSEIPHIRQIVQNECWLEGQRRGCTVEPTDDVVRQRVADIILNGAGEYIRRTQERLQRS